MGDVVTMFLFVLPAWCIFFMDSSTLRCMTAYAFNFEPPKFQLSPSTTSHPLWAQCHIPTPDAPLHKKHNPSFRVPFAETYNITIKCSDCGNELEDLPENTLPDVDDSCHFCSDCFWQCVLCKQFFRQSAVKHYTTNCDLSDEEICCDCAEEEEDIPKTKVVDHLLSDGTDLD